MAKTKVDEAIKTRSVKDRGGRPPKYPWKTWMTSTKPVQLKKGEHYTCSTDIMVQMIRNKATVSRKSVHMTHGKQFVTFAVVGDLED